MSIPIVEWEDSISPDEFADLDFEEETEPAKTWRMEQDRLSGFLDGKEAVRQAAAKLLHTQAFEYPIYSFSYGIDWDGLIGKDPVYVQAKLEQMIREALLYDDRITDVRDFRMAFSGEACACSFTVETIYGDFTDSLEVKI